MLNLVIFIDRKTGIRSYNMFGSVYVFVCMLLQKGLVHEMNHNRGTLCTKGLPSAPLWGLVHKETIVKGHKVLCAPWYPLQEKLVVQKGHLYRFGSTHGLGIHSDAEECCVHILFCLFVFQFVWVRETYTHTLEKFSQNIFKCFPRD